MTFGEAKDLIAKLSRGREDLYARLLVWVKQEAERIKREFRGIDTTEFRRKSRQSE